MERPLQNIGRERKDGGERGADEPLVDGTHATVVGHRSEIVRFSGHAGHATRAPTAGVHRAVSRKPRRRRTTGAAPVSELTNRASSVVVNPRSTDRVPSCRVTGENRSRTETSQNPAAAIQLRRRSLTITA